MEPLNNELGSAVLRISLGFILYSYDFIITRQIEIIVEVFFVALFQ